MRFESNETVNAKLWEIAKNDGILKGYLDTYLEKYNDATAIYKIMNELVLVFKTEYEAVKYLQLVANIETYKEAESYFAELLEEKTANATVRRVILDFIG